MPDPFYLETLIDFPDDALSTPGPITRRHLDNLMRELARAGIRRVVWATYADGHGGYLLPAGIAGGTTHPELRSDQNQWAAYAQTLDGLVDPLKEGVAAAHRHGIEVYAYVKPYETGPALVFHEGSPAGREWGRLPHAGGYLGWLDPFVVRHPELRIKRRPFTTSSAPIATLKLTAENDAPTRLAAELLEIWASDRNYRYQRVEAPFTFSESVEPSPDDVRDVYGNLVTAKGAPVRVLTLSGLDLPQPYIVVTTKVTEGEGTFANTWDRLLTAFDAAGKRIEGVHAAGSAIWFPQWESFPDQGLYFDTGRGPERIVLDLPNGQGGGLSSDIHQAGVQRPRGLIGFARGLNAYLPGALCETEPAVRAFWLQTIRESLEAGVDGIELRVENHSCHTDTPHEYGFNDVVLQLAGSDDIAAVTRVRTDAYTQFVREASALVRGAGKTFRVNLNLDWFRPAESRPGSRKLAYPANIDFDWRRWLDEGLLDAAVLRPFATPFDRIFEGDDVTTEMIERCRRGNVPLTVNRYVWNNEHLAEQVDRVAADGRFAGFILYETWSYMRIGPAGWWRIAGAKDAPPDPREDPAIAVSRDRTAGFVRQVLRRR